MKKYILCVGLAVISLAARAEDAPLPFPAKDVQVHYQDKGGPDPAACVMNYSAQLKKIRMQINGQPDYNIMDISAKRNVMIMDSDRAYIEINGKKASMRGMLPDATKLVRAGEDTVAGMKCTVWNEVGATAGGTVCVSSEGVLLRSHYNDGKNETTEATAVEFKPQPASLFEVPAGYEKMEMPMMPNGMGNIPGMPSGMKMPSIPADMDSQ